MPDTNRSPKGIGKIDMKYSIEELNLTKDEFHLICDNQNGLLTRTDLLNCKSCIMGNVYEQMNEDNLHKKWNVNKDLLMKKLDKLSYKETLRLLVAVDEFWDRDDSLYIMMGVQPPLQILSELE